MAKNDGMSPAAKRMAEALAAAKGGPRAQLSPEQLANLERERAERKLRKEEAKAKKAKAEKEAKQKVKYRKRQKTNAAIEAKRFRDKTIAQIQEINPFFSDPDNVLTQQQLSEKLGQYMDRKSDLDYIKEMNPELWEERLRSGRMPNQTTLAKEALYYLNKGAGDPNATVDQRKGITGVLETELPAKLNQAELDSILGESGSKTRVRIETNRTGTPQQFHAKQWNSLVRNAADKLEAEGKIPQGSSGVARPPMIDGTGPLSHKELWMQERMLDYGHLGAASNPGFHYVINYDSNGQPEFSYWNKQTSASMTPSEYAVADERIRSGTGYRWDNANKQRFNKYLDEMLGILDNAEFEKLSQTLEYFDGVKNSPYHLSDAQRNYVETTQSSSRPNIDTDSAYYLTNTQNNFKLDNLTGSEKAQVRKAAIASRLAFMRSLPSVDLNAAIHQGLLPSGVETQFKVSVEDEAKKVAQIPQEDIDLLKQNVLEVMKTGEPLTVDQVLRRAISKMPKAPVALIAMTSSMGKAFADSPADATTLEKAMSGLQAYDEAIVQPGREIVGAMTDALGATQMLRSLDDNVQQRFANVPDGLSKTGAEFIYGAAKDIPAEAIGLLRAAVQTPVAPAENMSWLERQQQNAWNNQDPMLNMVPVFQPVNPVKKFGGVVQPMYGDPMLYE